MRLVSSVIAALALAAAASGATLGSTAKLRLESRSPLEVTGYAFKRLELVRVTVTRETETAASKRVRASRTGTFTTRFDSVAISRCDAVRIVAIGSRGSRTTLKVLPAPLCLPALSP